MRFVLLCSLTMVLLGSHSGYGQARTTVAPSAASADRIAATSGSTDVPLDSWVYPAIERLASSGYVRTQFLGLRPWTRLAIAAIIDDAAEQVDYADSPDPFSAALLSRLRTEFADELGYHAATSFHVDSIYSRTLLISGTPLNDSYHFGQTITNDLGRPFGEGWNAVAGFSGRAEHGRMLAAISGEWQHAGATTPLNDAARAAIASVDNTPMPPQTASSAGNTFRLLDSYVGVAFAGQQLTVGKQSLWWGPGESGALVMSNNADPILMVRLTRVTPLELPGFLRWLGPVRYDNFFGRLEGHAAPPRPFIYGQKISLKPTPNLEFGFSRTVIFAGKGITPLTLGSFVHSFFSTTSGNGVNGNLRRNPGVRHSSFDFSYRVPGLRRWLTLYSDSLVHDDVSPLAAPRRAAINPGLYLSHVPGVPKLDFRVEAVSTDPPTGASLKGQFLYWEVIYRDLYLNREKLLGNWIGREGKGGQAWLTYWLSPSSTIQFSYRRAKLAKDFVAGGETRQDFSVAARVSLHQDLELRSFVQWERWTAPLLAPVLQRDMTASIELSYTPRHWSK